PLITAQDNLLCSGDSTQICSSTSDVSYLWNTGDNTSCISAKLAGGYWLTVTDANGCSALSNREDISVYPMPSVSIIVQGDTLSSFNAVSYQWYRNDTLIPGATSAVYTAPVSGDYSVQITDDNGCIATSTSVNITKIGMEDLRFHYGFRLYPNPSSGEV